MSYSILDYISATPDLSHMQFQFPDLITNGAWAIRRTALAERRLPGALANALNAKVQTGPKFQALLKTKLKDMFKVELVDDILRRQGDVALVELKQQDGDQVFRVNAKYLKMLKQLFPAATIWAHSINKAIYFEDRGEVIALLMPIQQK